jgi:hypothetical protein
MNKIEWKKSKINYDDLNYLKHKSLTSRENGLYAATIINKKQGKKNAKSGHMKEIQKIGATMGGKVGGVVTRDSGKLLEHSKLGNEANQQKHGKRIIGTNLITGESWEYISNHEAERDTKVPTCTIRKILRGEQPKTKSGWTFKELKSKK